MSKTPAVGYTKPEDNPFPSPCPPDEVLSPVILKLLQMLPELKERKRQLLAKQAQEVGD